MSDNTQIRAILLELREKAQLTQAQLAERLGLTANRVSMLESGETELTNKLAVKIARQIRTTDAKAFAEYLEQNWVVTEKPGFHTPNREHLWMAELALQKLQKLAKSAPNESSKRENAAVEKELKRVANELRLKSSSPTTAGETTILTTLRNLFK